MTFLAATPPVTGPAALVASVLFGVLFGVLLHRGGVANYDVIVNQFRFREFPDADMKHFVDYLDSGRPMIVVRTATHSFVYSRNKQSPYAKFDWQAKHGGFGGLAGGQGHKAERRGAAGWRRGRVVVAFGHRLHPQVFAHVGGELATEILHQRALVVVEVRGHHDVEGHEQCGRHQDGR